MNAMDFDDLLVPRRSTSSSSSPRSASATSARSATCSSTSTRTPTTRSTGWLQLLAGEHAQPVRWSATTDSRSTGFRGADIRNILDFADDFPDARTVKLEQNYRSTQTILDAANGVIRNNREQMHKDAVDRPRRGRPGQDPRARRRARRGAVRRRARSSGSSTRASRARRSRSSTGRTRSRGSSRTRSCAGEIGYQVIGGTKFYERAEIKDAIAYLTVLGNPQDVVSFTRVVNSPRRGIGQTSLSRVIAHANTMGIPVWDAAADPSGGPRPRRRGGQARSTASWARWRTCATRARGRRAGRRAARGAAARDRLPRRAGGRAHDRGAGPDREPRRSSSRSRREYDAHCRGAVARGFLQQIALVADADTRRDDEGLVTLMTLHNAKGLEYPIVFIIGCEEGVFPHSRAHRRGRPGGGAPARLRRHHPRDARPDADLRAHARGVRRAPRTGCPPASSTRSRPTSTDRQDRPTTWGAAAVASAAARPSPLELGRRRRRRRSRRPSSASATTSSTPPSARASSPASSPAAIVVVHFAGDGSERKLVADYAPIEKR